MKLLILIIAICSIPAFAVWTDQTGSVHGPVVTETVNGFSKTYLDFGHGREQKIKLDEKQSIQFDLKVSKPGQFKIMRGWFVIDTRKLDKPGHSEVKCFLEKGEYTVVFNGEARGKFQIWRQRKMAAVVPHGGGYPCFVVVRGKQYSYYRAGGDTTPVLDVKGPTTAYLYLRSDLSNRKKKTQVDFTVFDEDSVLMHKVQTFHPSKKASYLGDSLRWASDAIVVDMKVPEGKHKYSVRFNTGGGCVKFYKKAPKGHGDSNVER